MKSLWNHFRPQISEIFYPPWKFQLLLYLTLTPFSPPFIPPTFSSLPLLHPSHFFLSHKPFPPDTTSPAECLSAWPITRCVPGPAPWHPLRKTCQGSNKEIKDSQVKSFHLLPIREKFVIDIKSNIHVHLGKSLKNNMTVNVNAWWKYHLGEVKKKSNYQTFKTYHLKR